MDTTQTCSLCALARSAADMAGLAWSSQHEADGSVTWICSTCTRTRLWLIETSLPIAAAARPAHEVPLPRAA